MHYISTRGASPKVTASQAILQGLAPDGGLYLPEFIPKVEITVEDTKEGYPKFAEKLLTPFFEGDPLLEHLLDICNEAFCFPVPLHWLNDESAELELFHGPTIAFKDFGARFLAGALEKIIARQGKDITILVATSGDTGGAVASAFHKKKGISVKVLFPLGKVSDRQQQQLTCWDENITTYGVHGTFDDCQGMVKEAFRDTSLSEKWGLTSANSINLGRLLPQIVYHYYSSLLFQKKVGKKPVYIVPSGNVGNVTGAYIAKAMGAPIGDIVLAVNENKTIPDYLASGVYEPRKSVQTLANAMDVGDPSNMERLQILFPSHQERVAHIASYSVSDAQIVETIGRIYRDFQNPICPHTATGEWVRDQYYKGVPSIVVATAHPGKFESVVEPEIGVSIPVPKQLGDLLNLPTKMVEIAPRVDELFA